MATESPDGRNRSEEGYLLGGIRASGSEERYLEYAEFLQREGEIDRGDLIKLMCALEKTYDEKDRRALRQEIIQLLKKNPEWVRDFTEAGIGPDEVAWYRGTIVGAPIPPEEISRFAQKHPLLQPLLCTRQAARMFVTASEISPYAAASNTVLLNADSILRSVEGDRVTEPLREMVCRQVAAVAKQQFRDALRAFERLTLQQREPGEMTFDPTTGDLLEKPETDWLNKMSTFGPLRIARRDVERYCAKDDPEVLFLQLRSRRNLRDYLNPKEE